MKYYPLRPIQRWLIDTHFNKAKSTMMNIGGLFELPPELDLQRLAAAINEVLNRHDIFRCRLAVHPETSDLCQTFDGEIMPVVIEEWTDEEFETIQKYLIEPYDLIGKPLYRAYIFKTPSANYFHVDFYHAVMDGVAASILFGREIDKEYRGLKNSRKALSYAEYVEEEANTPPEDLSEGHDYWKKMLSAFDKKKHLPPIEVEGVPAWTQGKFECMLKNIPKKFFTDTRTDENNYFMGAAMLALAKITGSKESIMSWIHNGRMNMRERRLMGLMLEQIPCAWDFHEDISTGEFLSKLSEQTKTSMTYRKSLDWVYNSGLEDDCVSFIFQKDLHTGVALNGMVAKAVYLPPNEISAVENALDIEVEANDEDSYDLSLDYDASRYSEDEMRRFAEMMNEILIAMKNPDTRISALLT